MSTRRMLAALALFLVPACRSPHAPDPAPPGVAPAVLFHDVAASAGLTYRWGHKSLKGLTILDTIGHGCAFLDYDGDGKLDILLVGSEGCHLYHNRGDGTFEDVTARAFAPLKPGSRLIGCAVADYDGDGRPDIFVTGYGRTVLYHNEFDSPHPPAPSPKSGRGGVGPHLSPVRPFFRDVTAGSGLEARGPYDWSTSAAWSDYDGDGRLDLYVCRYASFTLSSPQLCPYAAVDGSKIMMSCAPTAYQPEIGSLYRNLGGGRFRDVTAATGLTSAHGRALGCIWSDLDGSGRPDLYIANDERPADLFRSSGAGRFRNVAVEAGVAFDADGTEFGGMGVDAADYDGDGRLDLVVGAFDAQPKPLFHNEGGLRFVDATYPSGVGRAALLDVTFGAAFLDASNRGLPDILLADGHVYGEVEKTNPRASYREPCRYFRNDGSGRFTEISAAVSPDLARPIVGRGVVIGDYDGDGRSDALIVDDEGAPLLLHNEVRSLGHWLRLRCLHGAPPTAAVGARITATVAGRSLVAETRASGSYLSTSAPDVHLGLASATNVDRVDVRWPDGRTGRYSGLSSDRGYALVEGSAAPRPLP